MVKYKALLGEKFDKSKITVVGSPTITSDGVASGFSEDNYIEYPITVNATNLRIKGSCIYKSGAGQQRVIGVLGSASTTTTTSVYLILTPTGFIFDGTVNGTWKRFAYLGIKAFADGDIIDFDITLGLNYQTYNFIVNSEKYSYNTALELSTFAGHTVLFSFRSTGNYNWAGKINLPSTKIYADNQLIYTPTKPTYLLERRKPKVWNKGQFTIVGNPSISDSGIANLVSGDAIYSNIHISNGTETIIEFDYTYKPSSTVQLLWIAYPSDIDHTELYWTYVYLDGRVASNNTISVKALSENVKYHFTIKTDFATYNETYVNGELWSKSTEQKTYDVGQIYFANRYDKIRPVVSPFDLKSIKITTDNNLVFDGGAETYVYDASKFTIVGSPTITEYGVASGFSGSQIKLPILNASGQIEKLRVGFNLLGTTSTASSMIARMYETDLMLYTNQTGRMEVAQPSRYGAAYLLGVEPINRYANCILELILDKIQGKLTVNYYEDNVLIRTNTESSTLPSLINSKYWEDGNSNNQWYLGKQGFSLFSGSIDLPSTSITVDGVEVFTGAKENYYMLSV